MNQAMLKGKNLIDLSAGYYNPISTAIKNLKLGSDGMNEEISRKARPSKSRGVKSDMVYFERAEECPPPPLRPRFSPVYIHIDGYEKTLQVATPSLAAAEGLVQVLEKTSGLSGRPKPIAKGLAETYVELPDTIENRQILASRGFPEPVPEEGEGRPAMKPAHLYRPIGARSCGR